MTAPGDAEVLSALADPVAGAHVLAAVQAHRTRVMRDGGTMPRELAVVLEYVAACRRRRQETTDSPPRPAAGDSGITPTGLMTTRQAAARLGVSDRTVQRLVERRELAVVMVTGRAVRFRPEVIENYSRTRESGTRTRTR